jgi:hypothetical protein
MKNGSGSRHRRDALLIILVLVAVLFQLFSTDLSKLKTALIPLKGRYAWVVITGVLGDLELESKVQHILLPLRDLGYHVHILVLLESDEDDTFFPPFREPYSFARASKFREGIYNLTTLTPVASEFYRRPLGSRREVTKNKEIGKLVERRGRLFRTREDIESYLEQHVQNLSSHTVLIRKPLINPPVNVDYIRALAYRDGRKEDGRIHRRGLSRIVWRAVNDVRQLEAYQHSWEEISRANAANDMDGIVIRLGDDALVNEKHNLGAMLEKLSKKKNAMITLPCSTGRGHGNDQVDIYPMSVAKDIMTIPYKGFYQGGLFPPVVEGEKKPPITLSGYVAMVYKELKISIFVPSSALLKGDKLVRWSTSVSAAKLTWDVEDAKLPVAYPLADQGLTAEPLNPTTIDSGKKKIFVCITGQLKRLELKNKFRTVIRPMLDAGYAVDLALVVSLGQAVFQLTKRKKGSTAFSDAQEVQDYVTSESEITFLNQHNFTYVKPSNPPVNPQFLMHKSVMMKHLKGADQTYYVKWPLMEESE